MDDTVQIHIGTSGWSYPKGEGTWNGYFYPPGNNSELEYYSCFFNTVEVNSTFYRPPDPRVSEGWVKKTPPEFIFTVKLWQKFTHPAMYRAATGETAAISSGDVTLFKSGIEPIMKSGKMGALLAQFPPSFTSDSYGKQILTTILNTFGEYRMAVELRHKSWSDDPSTPELLKKHNACWVQIDEPKFDFSIAPEVPSTSDMSYFRFHGRNAEMWWKGDTETRYMYLYSKTEIDQLAQKVAAASAKSAATFAFFNNHYKANAPRNAGDLIKVLQMPFNNFMDFRITE
jgi:uncharacterized protein YecE (DUF72 family)